MDLLLSFGLILILGFLIGKLFSFCKLPSLIGMILVGIIIGPSVLNIIDKGMYEQVFDGKTLSAILRQVALVVIITRAGLSLNFNDLKKLGRSAILMCFVPALFEIIGTTIFAPIIFNISVVEALLLGSVLAAVSPAVIVPRMIKLQEKGYKNVSNIVLAGASLDDIFVIILFYSFLGLVKNNEFSYSLFYELPLSIILGILLGVFSGLILKILFKKFNLNSNVKLLITLSISFLLIGIESLLKSYVDVSSLLGIMAIGMVLNNCDDIKIELKNEYNNLWLFFEIILFVLVGSELKIEYAFNNILPSILLFICSLTFRSIGVLICLIKSSFNFKEKLFIVFSYLPKATVQASIGGIALSNGLACGELILTVAVLSILVTAPIGAILIDNLYLKLLSVNVIEK